MLIRAVVWDDSLLQTAENRKQKKMKANTEQKRI